MTKWLITLLFLIVMGSSKAQNISVEVTNKYNDRAKFDYTWIEFKFTNNSQYFVSTAFIHIFLHNEDDELIGKSIVLLKNIGAGKSQYEKCGFDNVYYFHVNKIDYVISNPGVDVVKNNKTLTVKDYKIIKVNY